MKGHKDLLKNLVELFKKLYHVIQKPNFCLYICFVLTCLFELQECYQQDLDFSTFSKLLVLLQVSVFIILILLFSSNAQQIMNYKNSDTLHVKLRNKDHIPVLQKNIV